MSLDILKSFLLWCLIVDYAILILWFLMFTFARGWMYRLHGHWFKLSSESFDLIHYAGMAGFKLAIVVFNLTPLLALMIAT